MAENFGLVRKSMRPKLLDFLTRKHATNAELLWGNCILAMKNRQKKSTETTGNRYEIEILMSRTQKLKGLVAASLRVESLNDNA